MQADAGRRHGPTAARRHLDIGGWRAGRAVDRDCLRRHWGHGPHTNSGWLALLLAMMCLPFGSMLTLLGAAKWLRNRRLARARDMKKS